MITSNQFSFTPQTKTLVAEASDLQDNFGRTLMIKSSHTGKVELFELFKVNQDQDGDTISWEYKPVHELPKVSRVVIYND